MPSPEKTMRTQVGIVGAGPAGLVLAHLLALEGIESVVLEAKSREYVERRIRAGVLEQGTVELLVEAGIGERAEREGLVHHGIELRFDGEGHRIDLSGLTGGRTITIYGQHELVKDLISARLDRGPLLFEVEGVDPDGLEYDPVLRFTHEGARHELRCDVIAGCDGFHGVCRESIPPGELCFHQRDYPFAWFGILAEVAPSTEELIYAHHERGFALHSLRSPQLSRLYFQCSPDEDAEDWSDDQIWEELHLRLARNDGWSLAEGPIIEKAVAPMRSFVAEPMQHGRLFLAGDAVHIVPATGAKGLNLAVADVRILADALTHWFRTEDSAPLDDYSNACLRRVWAVQQFSNWMTAMLHKYPDGDEFQRRLQLAQLRYVSTSEAPARMLAENYVGLGEV